jgi:extracellular matrix protein 14
MILDIWSSAPTHVDIRLPKTSTKGFLSLLPKHLSKQHEQIITNLRAAVDYTYPQHPTLLPPLNDLRQTISFKTDVDDARLHGQDLTVLNELFFANYQPYDTIEQWLRLLHGLRPELVTLVSLGKSYEGREILGVVIHGNKSDHPSHPTHSEVDTPEQEQHAVAKNKLAILMHGAQHAREWISVSTVCYIASQLVAGYYVDNNIRKLVDTFEWRYPPSCLIGPLFDLPY